MCHSASHALGFRRALHCIYHTRFTIKERHTSPNELLLHGKNRRADGTRLITRFMFYQSAQACTHKPTAGASIYERSTHLSHASHIASKGSRRAVWGSYPSRRQRGGL